MKEIDSIKQFREADNGYSNAMKGRLQAALSGCSLAVVAGDLNGHGVKTHHLLSVLPPMPRFDDPVDEEVYKKALPASLQNFLFTKPDLKREGYIQGIGGFDYLNIPTIAANVASKRGNPGCVIRVVQGATTEMPLRALSYMLPALVFMDQLRTSGMRPPQLQMISAHHISGGLKGLDINVVQRQAELFAHTAQAYVQTFFPALSDSVVFLQDSDFKKGTLLREQLIHIARVVKENPSTVEEMLKAKGANNDAVRMYRFYAGAHLVVHDADLPIFQPLIQGQSEAVSPVVIISIGGKQEEVFYRLRQETKPHLGIEYHNVQTLQYFTKHHVPPYNMARGPQKELADQGLEAALHGNFTGNTAKAADHDLEYLRDVSYYRGSLREFLESQRRVA